jgi:hypothetical protein
MPSVLEETLKLSGITVGAVVVPQSMAYAKLAQLPPEFGLYSSFMGVLIYWFFATSKDITIGVRIIFAIAKKRLILCIACCCSLYRHRQCRPKGRRENPRRQARDRCLLSGCRWRIYCPLLGSCATGLGRRVHLFTRHQCLYDWFCNQHRCRTGDVSDGNNRREQSRIDVQGGYQRPETPRPVRSQCCHWTDCTRYALPNPICVWCARKTLS